MSQTQIDIPKTPEKWEKPLEDLARHSRYAAEYIRILLGDLSQYASDPKYTEAPWLVFKCFGPDGMEDDIAEIIQYLRSEVSPLARESIFKEILEATKDNSVYFHFISEIAGYFDIELEDQKDKKNNEPKPIRFYAPNLHFDRADEKNFFRACGLKEFTDEGNGSHVKWKDPTTGNFVGLSCLSRRIWLKNSIKTLLQNGLPVERIQEACEKLRIEFRVLSK